MEPLTFFLWMAGVLAWIATLATGIAVGAYGSTKVRKPPMTKMIIDLSDTRHGGAASIKFIKYSPKYGFFMQPVENPTSHGVVYVVEKFGFFGMQSRSLYWDKDKLLMFGEKSNTIGFYDYDMLGIEVREQLARLLHESGVKDEQLADLRHVVETLQRNMDVTVQERVDAILRQVQKTMPVPSTGSKARSRS